MLSHPKAPITPKQFANMYRENLESGMTSAGAFEEVFRICGKRWLFNSDGKLNPFYKEWWEATEARCGAVLERHLASAVLDKDASESVLGGLD